MKKEQSRLLEAINQFNGLLNARQRFYIGTAIKDALILGNRSAILTEDEAVEMFNVVEDNILTDARKNEEVRAYLNGVAQCKQSESGQPQQEEITADTTDITPKKYYEVFIKPALNIIASECAERFGLLFVKYICTGEKPADDALTDDEKLLWNVFMAMIEIKYNPDFSEAISEDEA